jgi:ABC-type branched-subunit amino acid transport system substrate-binding protein
MPHHTEHSPQRPRTRRVPRLLAAVGCTIALMASSVPVQAAPPKSDAIRIGAIVPESWPSAVQGQEIRNGMMLVLKTWPGYPAPVLEVKDSACDVRKAMPAAQALLDAKVDIVLGGWCEIGHLPAFFKAAGVPFVSMNAERYANADAAAQFGRVPANQAEAIAVKLRAETGLRVTANSVCWIDMEPRVSDKYDAALCPSLGQDRVMWADAAATYSAAFQKNFTPSAARGYAAMQVALAYVSKLRAGAKPEKAWAEAQGITTVLGRLPARDAAMPEDAMQLVLHAKQPKLPAREASNFDALVKTKGCGCRGKACPANGWTEMPFVVVSPQPVAGCPQPVLTSAR